MSTLKIALIATGVALTLTTGANAFELRPGNGSNSITVSPSTNRAAVAVSRDRSASPSVETVFSPANGSR
jgi:hypothetical protein